LHLARIEQPRRLIRQVIGDVTATSAVLDDLVVNMSVGDAKHEAIDNLFRHLQADLATLQRANAEACAGGARSMGADSSPSVADAAGFWRPRIEVLGGLYGA
jgi:hypothetical protein